MAAKSKKEVAQELEKLGISAETARALADLGMQPDDEITEGESEATLTHRPSK